jgi:hypothetical protein
MNIPRFIDQSFSLDISTVWEGVNLYETVQHVKVWPLKNTYVDDISIAQI